MMTLDEALMVCADNMRTTIDAEGFACAEDFALVCLAAEVRRLREENEQLANAMTQCYRMLLSEPDTQGALFKAENILRESLAGRGTK